MIEMKAMVREVSEKWGFGMAPPKSDTHAERVAAARVVLALISSPSPNEHALDALSIVKGMFNRVHRQDQWDWFTVAGQLGYPANRISSVIAGQLADLRGAIKTGDTEEAMGIAETLRRLPTRKCLAVFLGAMRIEDEVGAGWIYLLSLREDRDLAKVGMTTRAIEERVREINSATGVPIPYGVRGCWRVSDPARAERLVHAALDSFRIRRDREFFRAPFEVVRRVVRETIGAAGLELRTLDILTTVNPARTASN
jgi:hypothetical protein